jgi:LacI family transcriptional regulator
VTTPPPEDERPTLKTIARLSGLAVPTVSRALSDAPDIGKETKERVRALALEIGYRPNRAGVRLRTGKTNVIALVLRTDQDNLNHAGRLITSIASGLRGTSYHMIVTPYFPDEDPLNPIRYIVETRSADGVILNRIEPQDRRVAYLQEHRFPFATHGRTAACETHPYFDFDNTAFGRVGVERLAARGRTDILVVAPPLEQNYAQNLLEGATEAAARLGVSLRLLTSATTDLPATEIEPAIRADLCAHPETDAILTASAASAIACIIAAEEEGRVVGTTLDVAAKEAAPILHSFRRGIIVIREDVEQAGAFMAQAVMRAIDQPHLPPLQRLALP